MENNFAAQASKNVIKTWVLMSVFFCLVIGIGMLLSQLTGSAQYLYGALGASLLMNIVAYFNSDTIALSSSGAKRADQAQFSKLHELIASLAEKMGIPKPTVYVIEDDAPNAFATGRNPNNASVAVTTGLLSRLNEAELRGVMAHELSHVANRDILVMTVAIVLAGFVSIFAQMFVRASALGKNNRSGGPIVLIATIMALIVAPLAAQLLQLAVSRKREYLADATGAHVTNHPEGLASALEKIASYKTPMKTASYATAHLFISNPFGSHVAGKFLSGLFSTHPPIEDRIRILRNHNIQA